MAARLTLAGAIVVLALGLVGCGVGASRTPAVPTAAPSAPGGSVSAAVAQTRGVLTRALAAAGFQVDDPRVPYRPAETPVLAAAPRAVVQVLLADDPGHGFIVIYEFASASTASDAARAQAAFVASGPGRIQFPGGTRFVIRQLGTTVVFYAWTPGASADPRFPGIEPVLRGVGTPIDVAS